MHSKINKLKLLLFFTVFVIIINISSLTASAGLLSPKHKNISFSLPPSSQSDISIITFNKVGRYRLVGVDSKISSHPNILKRIEDDGEEIILVKNISKIAVTDKSHLYTITVNNIVVDTDNTGDLIKNIDDDGSLIIDAYANIKLSIMQFSVEHMIPKKYRNLWNSF